MAVVSLTPQWRVDIVDVQHCRIDQRADLSAYGVLLVSTGPQVPLQPVVLAGSKADAVEHVGDLSIAVPCCHLADDLEVVIRGLLANSSSAAGQQVPGRARRAARNAAAHLRRHQVTRGKRIAARRQASDHACGRRGRRLGGDFRLALVVGLRSRSSAACSSSVSPPTHRYQP